MDHFLTSAATPGGPDSLSLQEMLDMDIKSENYYDQVFNCGDLNFTEFPALNLDEDSLGAPGDNNVWMTSSLDSQLGGDTNSSLNHDLDSGETRMVCPNSVMPVTLIQVPYDGTGTKSEASLLKPVVAKLNNNVLPDTRQIKKEQLEAEELFLSDIEIKHEYESEDDSYDDMYARTLAMKNNHNVRNKVRTNGSLKTLPSNAKRTLALKTINGKRRLHDFHSDNDLITSAYPKPAYSYSCLIAMALKNSPSGSLPVSEIYNFMCEHFPYFKTAPNGWKNSVRHNLSLNKCFEKIEKPASNGSQRKGCLWAMNPNKINKMDEEVQKWSKKDKSAIRKSMVCPESLDALERGELSATANMGTSEAESDDETWDQNGAVTWSKPEAEEEDEMEEEEDDDDDKDDWSNDRLTSEQMLNGLPSNDEDGSDISLTDFDIAEVESIYNEAEAAKLNVRVNVQTSPHASFQPLASGAYTVNSQSPGDHNSKRLKTLGGSTITGNYVYKPLGTSSIRRKSPMRQSLLSSLEADD